MDRYLDDKECIDRLVLEYNRYQSLVVAFDFDSTVYDFHKLGDKYDDVIQLLRELKNLNCYLICFTASEDEEFVKDYLTQNWIPFDAVNRNPPFYESSSRKIYYNAYLDDRAGLLGAYNQLKEVIKQVKPK